MTGHNPSPSDITPSTSPLRLLLLTPATPPGRPREASLLAPLLQALTDERPTASVVREGGSFAGYTSHPPLRLRTKYYATDVGIWCDELPPPNNVPRSSESPAVSLSKEKPSVMADESEPNLDAWTEQMCSAEAQEVRSVIGAIVVALPFEPRMSDVRPRKLDPWELKQASEEFEACFQYLEAVDKTRIAIDNENPDREIPLVAVIQRPATGPGAGASQQTLHLVADEMQDQWFFTRDSLGWEFVGWDGVVEAVQSDQERDQLGEKTGMAKIVEVLELVDWISDPSDARDDLLDEKDWPAGDDEDDIVLVRRRDEDGIKLQSHELEHEMMDLKIAMREQEEEEARDKEPDNDVKVDQLPALMGRVVAIREAASGMGKEEKEKFARREVERLVREMS